MSGGDRKIQEESLPLVHLPKLYTVLPITNDSQMVPFRLHQHPPHPHGQLTFSKAYKTWIFV